MHQPCIHHVRAQRHTLTCRVSCAGPCRCSLPDGTGTSARMPQGGAAGQGQRLWARQGRPGAGEWSSGTLPSPCPPSPMPSLSPRHHPQPVRLHQVIIVLLVTTQSDNAGTPMLHPIPSRLASPLYCPPLFTHLHPQPVRLHQVIVVLVVTTQSDNAGTPMLHPIPSRLASP